MGKFSRKNQNYHFRLKFGGWPTSNMQNSMMLFTFSVFDWKYPFGQIWFKKPKLSVKLKFRRYLLLRLKNSRAWREHPSIQLLWATAQQLVTCFSFMKLVDESFCLFLVLLSKIRTPSEFKVSSVNQGNKGGRRVEDFLVLP